MSWGKVRTRSTAIKNNGSSPEKLFPCVLSCNPPVTLTLKLISSFSRAKRNSFKPSLNSVRGVRFSFVAHSMEKGSLLSPLWSATTNWGTANHKPRIRAFIKFPCKSAQNRQPHTAQQGVCNFNSALLSTGSYRFCLGLGPSLLRGKYTANVEGEESPGGGLWDGNDFSVACLGPNGVCMSPVMSGFHY